MCVCVCVRACVCNEIKIIQIISEALTHFHYKYSSHQEPKITLLSCWKEFCLVVFAPPCSTDFFLPRTTCLVCYTDCITYVSTDR